MRILIYGINYAPELVGIGKYTAEMAEWLASKGHDVRVVVSPPHYPAWRIQEGFKAWYSCEMLRNVQVYRCPIWVKQRLSGWQRILHLLSFAISSFPVLMMQIGWRPGIVLVIEPSFFCVPTTLLVAKLSRAKSWLHIQDFEIDTGFGLGMIPNISWLKKSILFFEKWLMKQFNRISTISEAMLENLYSKGIPVTQTFLFRNWVDVTQVYPLSEDHSLREHLGLSATDIIVLYAGSISNKQPLELLIRAAERLRMELNLHFVIVGEGPKKESIFEMTQTLQLKNVTFLPLLPVEQFNQMLSTANIHALIQKGALADLMMPSKLIGMMASGRPTIATAETGSAIATEIAKSQSGILVPPNHLDKLVAAIQYLANNPQECEVFGRNGRTYVEENLSKEAVLSNIDFIPWEASSANPSLLRVSSSSQASNGSH
jgi:colanic acid biosynthesis glycosyl transferase WcaI